MSNQTNYAAVAAECPHGYPAKVHDSGWEDGAVMVHVVSGCGKLCCIPGTRVDGIAHATDTWVRLQGERKSAAFESAERSWR